MGTGYLDRVDHPERDLRPASDPDEKGAQHYFTEEPEVPSRRSTVRLDLPDLSLDLVVDRGVFSPSRVDPGTKLLLTEVPVTVDGPVLDLGCGYGPIATTLAVRNPGVSVWAVDISRRALDLCWVNLGSNTPPGSDFHVLEPADVPEDVRFATIVSNPPIRVGKAALHEMLSLWLPRLNDDGLAWLVVNKNLGADSLARWIDSLGYDVERVRSRAGYRILRVSRRSATDPVGVDL